MQVDSFFQSGGTWRAATPIREPVPGGRWQHGATVALAAAAIAFAHACHAQTTWVGRVTIGDVIREDLTNALAAQQQATKNKSEFNRRIAKARQGFLETARTPGTRAKAEAEFAKLLLEKDLYFLTLYLNEGFSERNISIVKGLERVTGGDLDNGIPSDGRAAFESWVRGIRASLGAARDGQMAMAALQPDRLQQALQANDSTYQAYKRLRDRQEIQLGMGQEQQAQAAAIRDVQAATAPDGGARLFEQQRQRLSAVDLHGLAEGDVYRWMVETGNKGHQTLQCTYGPKLNSSGVKSYATYGFWYAKAPEDIPAMLARDPKGVLRFIGDQAIKECPPSDKAALALRRSLMARHPVTGTAQPLPSSPGMAPPPAAPMPPGLSPQEARNWVRSNARQSAGRNPQ